MATPRRPPYHLPTSRSFYRPPQPPPPPAADPTQSAVVAVLLLLVGTLVLAVLAPSALVPFELHLLGRFIRLRMKTLASWLFGGRSSKSAGSGSGVADDDRERRLAEVERCQSILPLLISSVLDWRTIRLIPLPLCPFFLMLAPQTGPCSLARMAQLLRPAATIPGLSTCPGRSASSMPSFRCSLHPRAFFRTPTRSSHSRRPSNRPQARPRQPSRRPSSRSSSRSRRPRQVAIRGHSDQPTLSRR